MAMLCGFVHCGFCYYLFQGLLAWSLLRELLLAETILVTVLSEFQSVCIIEKLIDVVCEMAF